MCDGYEIMFTEHLLYIYIFHQLLGARPLTTKNRKYLHVEGAQDS